MSQRPEGLRTSARPPGRLAVRWLAMLDHLDDRIKGRVLRGKTLARAGRVSALEVAPGVAFGEVQDASPQRATVRVRTFDEGEWARVLTVLGARLSWLAQLLEGVVSDELLAALEAAGVSMVPGGDRAHPEIDGDCDCGDWAVPCPHGAALHHVIGEALDGEPFLLFTLRGRTREQLLSDLRRSWGDSATTRGPAPERTETPPGEVDPFTSPIPPPLLSFRFPTDAPPAAMIELGPLPGDEDLIRALHPLYDAGASAARALALTERSTDATRRRRGRTTVPSVVPRAFHGAPAPAAATPAPAQKPNSVGATRRPPDSGATGRPPDSGARPRASPTPPSAPRRGSKQDTTERIVALLGEQPGGTSAADLANQLAISTARVNRELDELEQLGMVYRTGRGSNTRWFVG